MVELILREVIEDGILNRSSHIDADTVPSTGDVVYSEGRYYVVRRRLFDYDGVRPYVILEVSPESLAVGNELHHRLHREPPLPAEYYAERAVAPVPDARTEHDRTL